MALVSITAKQKLTLALLAIRSVLWGITISANRSVVRAIRAARPDRATAIESRAPDTTEGRGDQVELAGSLWASVSNDQRLCLHSKVRVTQEQNDFLEWTETNVGERNRERILCADASIGKLPPLMGSGLTT